MIIFINSKEKEIESPCSIIDLSIRIQLPERGTAIAINNKMIPREEWGNFLLQENDKVTVVKAACGG